uniref:E-selectin n=1 Tax=Xenopus tropicalis TaxID=8364 RepID=A0A6I8REP6_XENTR
MIMHLLYLGLIKGTRVSAWTYHYNTEATTWDAARSWCQTHFIDLVAIQTKAENDYLNEIIPLNKYWAGIRKINDIWTRVTTNKAVTTEEENWAKGEPSNAGIVSEDCVEIYIKRSNDSGKWNNERCDTKKKIALCYQASCNTTSCSQHGDCEEATGNYSCICHPGFYGPKCENAITCDPLQSPPHGWMNCTHEFGDFRYNSTCNFTCTDGFLLNGSKSMFCNSSGDWTQAVPTCAAIACEPLQSPPHGWMNCIHEFGDFRYNSTCNFTCTDGFLLNGSKSMFCNSSGDWTQAVPTCTAIGCQTLHSPSHGQINCTHVLGEFLYNTSCDFSCSEGFVLHGSQSVSCSSSGHRLPNCILISLNPPHGWMNCIHEFGDFRYNSTCNFTCTDGFLLNGSKSMFCNSSGDWTQAVPTCAAVPCLPLDPPDHAQMNCSHPISTFSYKSTCEFVCASGFTLNGSQIIECTSTTEWDPPPPACQVFICTALSNSKPRTMNCFHPNGGFSYGSECRFDCTEGFVLKGTSTLTCISSGYWSDSVPSCEGQMLCRRSYMSTHKINKSTCGKRITKKMLTAAGFQCI